jgi:hypothetical protein
MMFLSDDIDRALESLVIVPVDLLNGCFDISPDSVIGPIGLDELLTRWSHGRITTVGQQDKTTVLG